MTKKYMERPKMKQEIKTQPERPKFSTLLLKQLEPTLTSFKESPYFKGIEASYTRMADSFFAIPRPSGSEDEINAHLKEIAQGLGWSAEVDSYKNIGMVVPATPGLEEVPAMLVHFHTDIVAGRGENAHSNPNTDPIKPAVIEVDGKQWIKADDETTLGADDGAGAAALIQAVTDLTEEKDEQGNLKPHGTILIFGTSREEAGLEGMNDFIKNNTFDTKGSFMQHFPKIKRILNSDGEEADRLTIGALGGEIFKITLPIEYENTPPNYSFVKVSLKGFRGGHSGKYAWNPSPLAALSDMLSNLNGIDYRISTLQTMNTADNAIPKDASMLLAIPNEQQSNFLTQLFASDMKAKYPEDQVSLTRELPSEKPTKVLTEKSSRFTTTLLHELSALQGVAQESTVFGDTVLERSMNNGVVEQTDSTVTFIPFARMRGESQYNQYTEPLQNITQQLGAEFQQTHTLPFWEPSTTKQEEYERLLQMYKGTFGKDARLEFAPGGMEMSIFDRVYPDVLKVSNGVSINDAHIPGERMEAASLAELYVWNRKILATWRDELIEETNRTTHRRSS